MSESNTLSRRVAMCLMAHPDDCEILAAGTLVLLAQKGWEVHIVSMTAGDGGSMDLGPEAIAATRRAEGAAAAKIIGGHYHCLEQRDMCISFNEPTLRRAISLTRHISPSLMFTHSLQDYMLDHEITAQVARSTSFGYAVPNLVAGRIAQGAGVPWLYYADPIGGTDVYGQPMPATTYVDITSSMETKSDMLKSHASQRDWLYKHHGMDQYIKTMQDWAEVRGKEAGVQYAEGFRQHKGHPYPHDCVLQKELGKLVTHKPVA